MGLRTSLRSARGAAALAQDALARAAGISRQAYAAIESGAATPGTDVALRLARALGTTVDELFALTDDGPSTRAELVGGPLADPTPVQLHWVGDHLLARPVVGRNALPAIHHNLVPAHGIATATERTDLVDVVAWDLGVATDALVIAGCDPAIGVLTAHLQQLDVRVSWVECGSTAALHELARGHVHVAGCHLRADASAQFNVPFVRQLVPFPTTVVTFALWEQGLMVQPGNPKTIRGAEDLARPGVVVVNREAGSGSRVLLDRELSRTGISKDQLAGYDVEASGHVAVAEVVGMGLADVGVGVRAAAAALGLGFVPLETERYDLVIPSHFLNAPPVQRLLAALRRRELRRRVEVLQGYDATSMGEEVS